MNSLRLILTASVALVIHVERAQADYELGACDVDFSGAADAVDLQLTINCALGLPVICPTDVDYSEATDAVDVQLVVNAALGLTIDTDGDGLVDTAEERIGSDAEAADTDEDGTSDGWEMSYAMDPCHHPVAHPICVGNDWQPQDYLYDQSVSSAVVNPDTGCLDLAVRLIDGDENLAKGEAFLDFKFVPGMETAFPLDLSASRLWAQFFVPPELVWLYPPPCNGVQVFVKDASDGWKSRYGDWRDLDLLFSYVPFLDPGAPADEQTAPGFDPTRIRIVGAKIGAGPGSGEDFEGTISVCNMRIDPAPALMPPPCLPPWAPDPVPGKADTLEVRDDGFYLNGEKRFIVGGNWRVLEYGQNFGATDWFPWGNGIAKHANFVRTYLEFYRRAGIRLLRVNLFADGRTTLTPDGYVQTGAVYGFNGIFRDDVQVFLDLAADAGIKVEFTLLDFLVAGKGEEIDGVWTRGREEVITETDQRTDFINNLLVPFLDTFGGHSSLAGFDIINEPEWFVPNADGGGWDDVTDLTTRAEAPVAGDTLRSFVTDSAAAIRTHAPGKWVTVGVSLKHLSLVDGLDLDYYAVHYYPWMGPLEGNFRGMPDDKPWSLEEFPTAGTCVGVSDYLDAVYRSGGAGALLWNLSPAIDDATFPHAERNALLREIRAWIEAGPSPALVASAANESTETLCAEEDNIEIALVGDVDSFVIQATHPSYGVGTDNCEPDFASCPAPGTAYAFTPLSTALFDDGETVVEAVREESWWRPNGMEVSVDEAAPFEEAHYVRVYRKIKDADEWPQFFVLYMDGNLRLIPHPPEGASSVCFGSSVIVGPVASEARPIAEIASVRYDSASKNLAVEYAMGGSALLNLAHVERSHACVRVDVAYPTASLPFAAFRSMFVAEGNADVDHVRWVADDGTRQDQPILQASSAQGVEWFFYRATRSTHNTSTPDILVTLR